MKIIRRSIAFAVLAAVLLAPFAARAHTTIVLAGEQIVPGGYVAGQRVQDGPAVDGTLIFNNVDPVAYTITGTCVTSATCSGSSFSVTVPATTANREFCKSGLKKGTYLLTVSGKPMMKGEVRVTPDVVACH